MTKLLLKFLQALIFWGVFGFVVLQVSYPNSLTQSSIFQLLSFFIPLFLALFFTINIFLRFIFFSALISLGVIFLLFLKALDSLNFISAGLTIIAVSLLLSYFKKSSNISLTYLKKIPKLTSLHRRKR